MDLPSCWSVTSPSFGHQLKHEAQRSFLPPPIFHKKKPGKSENGNLSVVPSTGSGAASRVQQRGAVPCRAVLSCACGCPARARRGYRALPLPAGAGGSRRCSIRERQEPREAGRDLPISGRLRGGDTDKMAAPN